jgi:RNA polymerase sigma-70 factor, ECF subfamily
VEFFQFDEKYLERLRSSDPSTEQHFYSYFSKYLQIKVRSRLRSSEAVHDIIQETFLRVLKAVRSPDSIRNPERLGAYVNSVCNLVLLEYYRSQKREDPLEDQLKEPTDHTIDLEGTLTTEETREEVRRILTTLDPKDRKLLNDVILEERDKDEVCRELGVDRDYLRVLLHRAKIQFKKKYK